MVVAEDCSVGVVLPLFDPFHHSRLAANQKTQCAYTINMAVNTRSGLNRMSSGLAGPSSEPASVSRQCQLIVQKCYRPTGLQWLKCKGAVMILIWCHLVFCGYYLIRHKLVWQVKVNVAVPSAAFAVVIFVSPIAGWLADVYFGRYKVLKWSVWTIWISSMLLTASSVVAEFVTDYEHISTNVTEVAMMIVMEVGLAGFASNIIQFSMDQLPYASTVEIVSFIRWLAWTYFSSGAVLNYTLFCTERKYELIGLLVVTASLTLAVCLDILFNHHLIKEPVAKNPFRVVFDVVRYAIKTKHPRCRSAFTYCEDELPSRIDFGKSKYGGPFTTEQVEDVKTFLRLLPLIIVSGIVAGVTVPTFFLSTSLSLQYTTLGESNMEKVLSNCYSQVSMTHVAYFSGTVLIALHELFICPVFNRCCPRIKSLRKIVIGVVLQIVWVTTLMAFDVLSRHLYLKSNGYNATIQCIFYESHSTLSTSFSYHWLAIPNFLQFTSIVFCLIGIIEFISAQVPYSMKGLIIGLLYSLAMFFATAIGLPSLLLFKHKLSTWGTGTISCGFWYALLVIVVELFICAALLLFMRWYKNRKREDVLPNEHFFAERYYSKNTM